MAKKKSRLLVLQYIFGFFYRVNIRVNITKYKIAFSVSSISSIKRNHMSRIKRVVIPSSTIIEIGHAVDDIAIVESIEPLDTFGHIADIYEHVPEPSIIFICGWGRTCRVSKFDPPPERCYQLQCTDQSIFRGEECYSFSTHNEKNQFCMFSRMSNGAHEIKGPREVRHY